MISVLTTKARFTLAAAIFAWAACSCRPTEYFWDGGDTDTSTYFDTDTNDSECTEFDTSCDDAGPGGGDGDVDSGPDFCESDEFAEFLSGTPFEFNNENAPHQGNVDDPEVELTLFTFFLCPHCLDASIMLAELFDNPTYYQRAAYYLRNYSFNTTQGETGCTNHQAGYAAHMQGRFWEMHDWMFANYGTSEQDDLFAAAEDMGFNMIQFALDYDSPAAMETIIADKAEADLAGLTGTPTMFVNGVRVKPWSNVPHVIDCLLGIKK